MLVEVDRFDLDSAPRPWHRARTGGVVDFSGLNPTAPSRGWSVVAAQRVHGQRALLEGLLEVGGHVYGVPAGALLLVEDGDTIEEGALLAEWIPWYRQILAPEPGRVRIDGDTEERLDPLVGIPIVRFPKGGAVRLWERRWELRPGAELCVKPEEVVEAGALIAREDAALYVLVPDELRPDPSRWLDEVLDRVPPDEPLGEELAVALLKCLSETPRDALARRLATAHLRELDERTHVFEPRIRIGSGSARTDPRMGQAWTIAQQRLEAGVSAWRGDHGA
ncbi:MAG TPA: hypothetical protein QGF58_07105 [Myxococcota bacterium]|nr:hypothetical protein [Myxococcota bacterium]